MATQHVVGLGSTTGLTTGTGTQTDTYGYDVFGAVRSRTGTSANEFAYTGEQTDPSGLQYLRARYYDKANGRFVSQDPLPLTQRYAYAGGNPVNLVDPYGLSPESDYCSAGWGIGQILGVVTHPVRSKDCLEANQLAAEAAKVAMYKFNCGEPKDGLYNDLGYDRYGDNYYTAGSGGLCDADGQSDAFRHCYGSTPLRESG